jgi:hypothetical protein
MSSSWRTTMAGIGSIAVAVGSALTAIGEGQPVEWGAVIAAVIAGIGLISARDNRVTSEQAGAN